MEQLELIQAPYYRDTTPTGEWTPHADKAIATLANTGRPFTNDDVRALIPDHITPHHPNAWGSLFSVWAGRGLIKMVGVRNSRQKSRHSGLQRVWQGTNPKEGEQAV